MTVIADLDLDFDFDFAGGAVMPWVSGPPIEKGKGGCFQPAEMLAREGRIWGEEGRR